MKTIFTLILFYCLTTTLYGQKYFQNDTTGLFYAKQDLKEALQHPNKYNYLDEKTVLLNTKDKAVNFAELILFEIYGQKNIENQRPYKIFNIDNYWVIKGTLQEAVGGVFLIIIDSHNCKIVKIIHGK